MNMSKPKKPVAIFLPVMPSRARQSVQTATPPIPPLVGGQLGKNYRGVPLKKTQTNQTHQERFQRTGRPR